jgi:hypothetical protein
VGVRRFEDLIAWQLADELHREILEFTATPPAANDRDFCNQIRTATRSAKTNTSEGFGTIGRSSFGFFGLRRRRSRRQRTTCTKRYSVNSLTKSNTNH